MRRRKIFAMLLDVYVIGIATLIAPLLGIWLLGSGRGDLARALVLTLPLPMLVVLLILERRDRRADNDGPPAVDD